jgi:hypothetical protein
MKKAIVSILLLASSSTLFQSCKKMEAPQFRRLENFEVKKMGLQEAIIGFDATFYNPNQSGLNVKEAVFDIFVDSLYLG